ncbi:MAG: protein-methionine-sulfoxide reductase catalytic subunit MsrP [Roseomonas sp.]|nr:protein-methionine-sulfoxide reductase catalytic subunit MsrP [Roseomonas sp.]MCA3343715.1 protein-methionine-sulfoxide reductase catalytic subunit MsrP [Roseomonas sp.]
MHILKFRRFSLPESQVTPEALVFNRRQAMAVGAGMLAASPALAQQAGLPPAMRNTRYVPGRAITAEREVTTYNNFYEFGSHKTISAAAQRMPQRPWTVRVEGMVENPRNYGIEDLLARMPLEERVYRLRCVEAWAMVVPWTGFPLSALLAEVKPLSSARYVVFQTATLPSVMPGLRQSWYPWPYTEGCTIAEAANELSFMVVGAYGKLLPPQNGGPIRFHQPWKYGFKAGKSIVTIRLTDQRPVSFWEKIQSQEYGFWANVNPAVPHPRWSQAQERMLGTGETVPTLLFNGYGEFVADLYTNLQRERLWA